MSLRPSRIQRNRSRGEWRKQFRRDSDACPGDLPRLPAWGEDEEADGSPHDRPSEAEAAVVADSLLPGEAAASREVPVKLRHLRVAADAATWRPCISWRRRATTGWSGFNG